MGVQPVGSSCIRVSLQRTRQLVLCCLCLLVIPASARAGKTKRAAAPGGKDGIGELSKRCDGPLADPRQLYELGAASLSRGGSAGGRAAQKCFHRATEIAPMRHEGWLGKGKLAEALKKHGDAEQLYGKAIRLSEGRDAEPFLKLGSLMMTLQRLPEAEAHLRRAVAIDHADPAPAYNLGLVMMYQRNYEDGLEAFLEAERREPQHIDTQVNLGAILFGLGEFGRAVEHLRKAIKLRPNDDHAWRNLGSALAKDEQWLEAGHALEQYLRIISPQEDASIAVRAAYCRQQTADWSRKAADDRLIKAAIVEALAQSKQAPTSPFNALSMSSISGELTQQIAEAKAAEVLLAAREEASARKLPLWQSMATGSTKQPEAPYRRLRIGYVSPDFREHPVGSIMLQLLSQHNRSRAEAVCYAINPDNGSKVRQLIQVAAERFVDINGLTDLQAADRIRADGIDVLFNLGGYTQYMRNGIFALQPAPVQVLYIGYASTTGAPYVQYVIGDWASSPPSFGSLYSEKLAMVTGSLLPLSHQLRYPLHFQSAASSVAPEDTDRSRDFHPPYGLWAPRGWHGVLQLQCALQGRPPNIPGMDGHPGSGPQECVVACRVAKERV